MDKIAELLTRGVDKIYPRPEDLEKLLRSERKITVFQGFDPTGDRLHVGHMMGLKKLRQFQDLGHHVIFLLGTATVQAGDPSGKKTAREKLRHLIVKIKEDKPGILRRIAEAFEIENVNMTAIDSQEENGSKKFKIGVDKNTPRENLDKVISLLSEQGFIIEDESHLYAKNYIEQAKKIVNFQGENPAEIRYNSDWLNQLNLTDVLNIAGHFSLQQLSERDLFQERMKKNEEVNLREFLYPLMQAYDSVAMKVDLEVGGSDQTFNMLMGRKLAKDILDKEKLVLTTPLLTDSEGKKIGKSEGNVIGLTDEPKDLFGKIMSLSDDIITKGFEYLTDVPMGEVSEIENKLNSGANPIEFKKKLAFEIVKELNSEEDARRAQEAFEHTVQKGELPEDIPVFEIDKNEHLQISDLLVKADLATSKSEAKRLVEQGGVQFNSETITNPTQEIVPEDNVVIKAGKRSFVRLKVS